MKSLSFSILVVAGVLLAACAPRATGSSPGMRGDVITSDQMTAVNASTAYEAVQRIQPGWLSTRSPSGIGSPQPDLASVYVAGNYMGTIEALHRIRPHDLEALRYYEAGEATARFGRGHARGVIDVIMKGADDRR